uniref:Neurotrophin-3-like n=1 Tax=Petromyzon marinus TaxID=7757 RepID=A0AAJ7XGX0_PETMA|nr:neurotrophin-3-like [Petromyzon marinus]
MGAAVKADTAMRNLLLLLLLLLAHSGGVLLPSSSSAAAAAAAATAQQGGPGAPGGVAAVGAGGGPFGGRSAAQQQQQQQQRRRQGSPPPPPPPPLLVRLLREKLSRARVARWPSASRRDGAPARWRHRGQTAAAAPPPGPAAPPVFGSGSARPGTEDAPAPSPRVILSERRPLAPPPLFGIGEAAAAAAAAAAASAIAAAEERAEEAEEEAEEEEIGVGVGAGGAPWVAGPANGTARSKRHPQGRVHRGEYSVCDSESRWVTDKPSAFDIHGHRVRVLLEFSTAGRPVRQYFYETRCKGGGGFGSSCRGIDERHWDSRCKTTQSYVRALTLDKSGQSVWTWIRIDTACVCTLTRKFGRY